MPRMEPLLCFPCPYNQMMLADSLTYPPLLLRWYLHLRRRLSVDQALLSEWLGEASGKSMDCSIVLYVPQRLFQWRTFGAQSFGFSREPRVA